MGALAGDAQLAGRLDLPDPAAARMVQWIPPRWDWVDPLKDIQAQVLAMEAGITSRRKVVEGTTSIGAASLVWSKAPAIVGAHDTGPLIRSKTGFWLAIPTPAAGRGLRGGKITPGEWERRRGLRLRFVYRRCGPSLLVADRARINKRGQAVASRAKTGRNQVTAPIFLLVPQVKLPKRLDLDRDAERAHDSLPGLIVANWVEGRFG